MRHISPFLLVVPACALATAHATGPSASDLVADLTKLERDVKLAASESSTVQGASPGCEMAEITIEESYSSTGSKRYKMGTETSGLVASAEYQNVYYAHDDSGSGSQLHVLKAETRGASQIVGFKYVRSVEIAGAKNKDWEDIALGPCPDDNREKCVFIGNIGCNGHRSKWTKVVSVAEKVGMFCERVIYTVREKDLHEGGNDKAYAAAHHFEYDTSKKYDSEAFVVHPRTGIITIFGKVDEGRTPVFVIDPSAEKIRKFAGFGKPKWLAKHQHDFKFSDKKDSITGADVKMCGEKVHVLIRNYEKTRVYAGLHVSSAVASTPVGDMPEPTEVVGRKVMHGSSGLEAICWLQNGYGFATMQDFWDDAKKILTSRSIYVANNCGGSC